MDIVSKTLHHIGKTNPNAFVLQVGAMDGINFDNTRGFLDMYKWPALLVEPIPALHTELKENFKDRDNYIFEQSAISSFNGEIEMLTVPPDVIEKEGLHPGYKGMSAVYPLKNGFGSDYQRDIDVKAQFGVNLSVPCLTFDSLCEKHQVEKIDIFICDAEGSDWEIFKQFDFEKYDPSFIRLEYINLTDEEKVLIQKKLEDNGYITSISQDIDGVKKTLWEELNPPTLASTDIIGGKSTRDDDLTIVTGLWDIGRPGRNFDHYIECFRKFLEIPNKMFIYIPEEYEHIVWEIRSKENTYVKTEGLDYLRKVYDPFWDKTQEIRTDPNWFNMTGEGGWLKESPQAVLEYYNVIVQSKMFLVNDATIWNPFNSEYFIWLDAGITNTVNSDLLINQGALDRIIPHLNSFLFLSYPYETNTEIHGFDKKAIDRYAGDNVNYVCRGGLFGGKKEIINQANATYYSTLKQTLDAGYMGTEESIFTIMSYKEPHIYDRYALDSNGFVVKFIEQLLTEEVPIEPVPKKKKMNRSITNRELSNVKTNSYILTFNFPQQLLHTIESMEKVPEWLEKPHLVLIDNSTDEGAKDQNRVIADEYNMEYIPMDKNTGICGGRQKAAEHFHASDADYMFFFEDDMTINSNEVEGEFCRNGFRKYVPNLYNILHKIIMKEKFDFVKVSFTEVYFDNDKALPWYNVPQAIRTRDWPDYDQLPVTGLDPNSPPTKYDHIRVMDGVAYISGEVNYCNWPMIVSKEGNEKMFIETKWAHPYEQTWSSHIHQITKEGKIHSAVLLASPIWHDRILWYKPEERREN